MAESTTSTPSWMGGLTRYNESYNSNISLTPTTVTVLIVVVIIGMAALKILTRGSL